jgi:hypothetical protein
MAQVGIANGTSGGAEETSVRDGMTSGGVAMTSGDERTPRYTPARLVTLTFVSLGLVYLVVDATTVIEDRRTIGQPVAAWEAWTWEGTSFLAWLMLLPVILWITARAMALDGWPRRIALHLAGVVGGSLAHSGLIWALRQGVYAAMGERYRLSGPLFSVLQYEFRKDAITYGMIVLAYWLFHRLAEARAVHAQREAMTPAAPSDSRIEVRDGSRVSRLRPDEIEWLAAAGNYVELHGSFGTMLARQTLASMASTLTPHGFARIHRSRLVRRDAICSIDTRQSGDFDVTLRSGATIQGSRRYRSGL